MDITETDPEDEISNSEATEGILNLNEAVNTLTTDLREANEEIQKLRSQISKLGEMVIEREEEIVKLNLKLKLNKDDDQHNYSIKHTRYMKKQIQQTRFSLPLSNRYQALDDSEESGNDFIYEDTTFPPLVILPTQTRREERVCNSSKKTQVYSRKTQISKRQPQPVEAYNEVKRRVLILSDSHGKDLNNAVQQRTPHSVTTISRPGATLSGVISDIKDLAADLTKNDVVVVIGGTNDLEMCSAVRTLGDVNKVCTMARHTNLILATIPLRHDKPEMDGKVSYLNQQIRRQAIPSKPTTFTLLPLDELPRHLHTTHGLHFNRRGKSKIGQMIAGLVHEVLHQSTHPYAPTTPEVETLQKDPSGVELQRSASPVSVTAIVLPNSAISSQNELSRENIDDLVNSLSVCKNDSLVLSPGSVNSYVTHCSVLDSNLNSTLIKQPVTP